MHLLIDVQACQSPTSRRRGIGRYARNLIAGLARAQMVERIDLVQSAHLPPVGPDTTQGLPLYTFSPPLPPQPDTLRINQTFYGDWLQSRRPNAILLLSTFEPEGIIPEFIDRTIPLIVLVYDLIPLLFAGQSVDLDWLPLYARRFRQTMPADLILAISEATKVDVVRFGKFPAERVINIQGAPQHDFQAPSADDLLRSGPSCRARLGLERDFVLCVSAADLNKNLQRGLEAFALLPTELRDNVDFVLTGNFPSSERAKILASAERLGIRSAIKLTGYVTDEDLKLLYGMCRVFFFPSLYEGLGLPIIEALRCGAPVVAGSLSSIPEYAGPCSRLANPLDSAALAQQLAEALREPRETNQAERIRFSEQFCWAKTAEIAVRAIEKCRHPIRPARPRIAWVAPQPPAATGIADYCAILVEHLRHRWDIDWIVDPSQDFDPAQVDCERLGPEEFVARQDSCPYDLTVYQMGNNQRYHGYMPALMERYPGLVVLHDFHLGHLVRQAAAEGTWPTDFRSELAAHGEDLAVCWLDSGGAKDWVLENLYPLNRRILSAAEGILVHSRFAREQVSRLVDVPVCCIPQFAPPPPTNLGTRTAERARLGLGEDRFVVGTFGEVGFSKRLPSLYRALALLPERIRERLQLLIVGRPDSLLRPELDRLADELGLASGIAWTGRVAIEEFAAYARACDVVVQLRYPTRGESSGALARVLGIGCATIVSDVGAMQEIPDHVVRKVRSPSHEVEDLVAHLIRLHDEPADRTRLEEAAAKYANEELHIGRVIQQYELLFELTIHRRRSLDSAWRTHVTEILAAAAMSLPEELLLEWARLRTQARQHDRMNTSRLSARAA